KYDAHILLQNGPEDYVNDVYEVVIGAYNNTRSQLRLVESVSIPHMTTTDRQGKPRSQKDEDERSYIVIGFATSTGCLGAMLLLTLLSVCLLWKKRKASGIGICSNLNLLLN
ncbi:hypothetical protein MAR_031905, partial [Mya arenaria]